MKKVMLGVLVFLLTFSTAGAAQRITNDDPYVGDCSMMTISCEMVMFESIDSPYEFITTQKIEKTLGGVGIHDLMTDVGVMTYLEGFGMDNFYGYREYVRYSPLYRVSSFIEYRAFYGHSDMERYGEDADLIFFALGDTGYIVFAHGEDSVKAVGAYIESIADGSGDYTDTPDDYRGMPLW